MALIDLPEHDQWHGQMLALIQRTVEFDRFFGSRHALLGTSVREGAAGDSETGKKARLKAEIADTTRNSKAAPAHLYGLRRVDYGVEHAEISVTAAGCVEKAGGFGGRDTLLNLTHRLLASPEPRQRNTFGVARLRSGARCFESGVLIHIRRHGLSVGQRLVCPPHGPRMIAHAKRKVAALLQELRPLDRRVRPLEQRSRFGVMRLRFVPFAGIPQQSAQLAKYSCFGGAISCSPVGLQRRLVMFLGRVTTAGRPTQVGNLLVQYKPFRSLIARGQQHSECLLIKPNSVIVGVNRACSIASRAQVT